MNMQCTCENPKPISRIKAKYRGDAVLAVIREDNTLTVYVGGKNDLDHQLIAFGNINADIDASVYFPGVDVTKLTRITE